MAESAALVRSVTSAQAYSGSFTKADARRQIGTLRASLSALSGDLVRACKGWLKPATLDARSAAQDNAFVAEQARLAADRAARDATWWDKYKMPVYIGAGVVGLALAAYLLGPAFRGLGARMAPKAV